MPGVSVSSVAKRTAANTDRQALKHVGSNLDRSDTSIIYYAILNVSGKQIRRSLRVTDQELARRRVEDLRRQVGCLIATHGRHRCEHVGLLVRKNLSPDG